MTASEERFESARQAAYNVLSGIRPFKRRMIAEAAAAYVIGKGDWPIERYQTIADNEDQRHQLVLAAMRDLGPGFGSGSVDAAIRAAAEELTR